MLDTHVSAAARWIAFRFLVVVGAAVAGGACAGGRPTAVSPNEIPELEAKLAREPGNGDVLLRYSAALFAAGRCDSAHVVALAGMSRRPESAVGPLVIGQCQERAGDYDEALAVYRGFLAEHPDGAGSAAVRARAQLALRQRALARAQDALSRESELAQQPADPRTIAVLPLDIVGDSTYQPLARGLAQIITSDLDLLQQFRLVERLEVGALVDEMHLGETERVDPATAARVGHLLQAGRMVQGMAAIPPEGDVRLDASVVRGDGQVAGAESQTGRLRDLLKVEKSLVVGIANALGYQLSEAERRRILENGTQNLAAFLAYSRGLVAEDAGDYSTAALYFGEAVRRDPGFRQARQQYQASTAAPQVQAAAPSQVTTVASEQVEAPIEAGAEPTADAIATTLGDVAGTPSEQATATGSGTDQGTTGANTNTSNPTPTTTTFVTTNTVTGTIRIVFRLP